MTVRISSALLAALAASDVCNPLRRMEIRFDGIDKPGGLRSVNAARFGMVRNEGTRPHQGVDLYARSGTPIYAIANGEVVRVRRHDPSYGQEVMIRFVPTAALASQFGVTSGSSLYVLYAHLSQISVAIGKVNKGQVIGASGTSGNADQRYPHLHFEIRSMKDPGTGLQHRLNPEKAFLIDYSKPVEVLERLRTTA